MDRLYNAMGAPNSPHFADDGSDVGEEDDSGPMASLFARMYTPYGFRVVCEVP